MDLEKDMYGPYARLHIRLDWTFRSREAWIWGMRLFEVKTLNPMAFNIGHGVRERSTSNQEMLCGARP